MTPLFDVVCVGAANLDTIVPVERVPRDDERMLADGFLTAGGGPAATAAVTLARLGVRVAFCGVVGDDEAGGTARDQLEREGVDTRWLRSDPESATARAVVMTARATGGRSIITTAAPSPRPDDIPVDRSAWVHVDQIGYSSARAALDRAPGSVRFSIDAGNPIADLDLSGVELYAPTAAAVRERFGSADLAAALDAAHAEGARQVVATAGSEGTWVRTADGLELVPGFEVDVVSTLGAGDVFHGALLAGLVDGRDLPEATRFANAVAALSCRGIDGRSGIPTRPEVDSFLITAGPEAGTTPR